MADRKTWYQRGIGFWGNLYWQWTASAAYLLLAYTPLVVYALNGFDPPDAKNFAQSCLGIMWALVVSVGYPLWSWGEIRAFERWATSEAAKRQLSKDELDRERAYFKLMMDSAKNFWSAVLAIYTIAGLWTLATR